MGAPDYWMRESMMWRSLQIDEDFRWITASEICIILHIIWKPLLILGWRNVQMSDYHCRADTVMHQSIPAAPSAPPPFSRADPRALAFVLPWMANSRGWGLLSCQMPRGGDENRGQMPSPRSTLQHFLLIAQSNNAVLSILMCDFSFQWTPSFVIALGF